MGYIEVVGRCGEREERLVRLDLPLSLKSPLIGVESPGDHPLWLGAP